MLLFEVPRTGSGTEQLPLSAGGANGQPPFCSALWRTHWLAHGCCVPGHQQSLPLAWPFLPACFLQVLMATNRIDILDAALLRPGRIDRKIEFPNPNEAARVDILKIHSRCVLRRGSAVSCA